MSDSAVTSITTAPSAFQKSETSHEEIRQAKNCCIILAVGSILATIGFTLLFYSPLNLATSTGLTKCIVGSVLASTGSLLIIYKVFVNCSTCRKEIIEESEQERKDQAHYKALLKAIKERNLEGVRQFWDTGLPINRLDEKGWAPLHYAAQYGNSEIIQELIQGGADIDLRSKKDRSWEGDGEKFPGQTPLHCALFRPPLSELQILMYKTKHEHPEEEDENRRLNIVTTLLQLGASPDILDDRKASPTFIAEFYNYHKIANALKNAQIILE